MESAVRKLFERYERLFNQSLGGDLDVDEVVSLYAAEFIGAAPAGVMTGKNDERFRQAMVQGHAHYMSFAGAAKHVAVLARAGLIERRKVGRQQLCRLEASRLQEASAWLKQWEGFWNSRLDALEAALKEDPG
ncbi:MAG: hypothetical protein IT509_07960 [Rhodocyclaceae bacterium]|nr:hypothetical protein [Rhodocyclaceae bacterium]